MHQKNPITIIYRGEEVRGEWQIQRGYLIVTSKHGTKEIQIGPNLLLNMSTAEVAKEALRQLARNNDKNRPLFYWKI